MIRIPAHKQTDPGMAAGQITAASYKPAHGGYPAPAPRHDPNGRFIVAAVRDPAGMKPGRYFYVVHMATGRKVSRYLRKLGTADRKAVKYAAWYANGDHYWPEVGRCDELRDSKDVVWGFPELLKAWLRLGCAE